MNSRSQISTVRASPCRRKPTRGRNPRDVLSQSSLVCQRRQLLDRKLVPAGGENVVKGTLEQPEMERLESTVPGQMPNLESPTLRHMYGM
jgi:hypothetical protein